MSSSETSISRSNESEPGIASYEERVKHLRTAYQDILQASFFRHLEHDWLQRAASVPDLHSPASSAAAASSPSSVDVPTLARYPSDTGSGSFIVLNGRKFPLECFRSKSPPKAIACCQRGQDSQQATTARDGKSAGFSSPSHDDYANPYAVVQHQQQQRNVSKNRFHTARSRARQDIRSRLHVEELPYDAELFGVAGTGKQPSNRYRSQLATELDAYYCQELTYRPRIRRFLRHDAMGRLRESGRRQFETLYRREYLLGQRSKCRQEDECYRQLAVRCGELQQAIAIIRQERFSATMRVLDTMKPYFERSAELEQRHRECQARLTALWNRVVQLESVWVRRLKLQNFLYLIMPKEWRERYDWIHQDAVTGQLESIPVSIARRDTANIRDIYQGNDIWAVKRFYEEQYLAHAPARPLHPVYRSSAELLAGVADLNTNSMTLLSRLDLMNWVKSNAEIESAAVRRAFDQRIDGIRRFIQDTVERRHFQLQRTAELTHIFQRLVDGPLHDTVLHERHRQIESLVTLAYTKLLPPEQREQGERGSVKLSAGTCFAFIFELVLQLLADFDRLPAGRVRSIERQVRFRRRLELRQAVRAADEQHRIGQLAVQLQRGLAPPYQKPRGKQRPRRSRLRRQEQPVVEPQPPKPSRLEEIFRLAFGEQATMTPEERRNFEIDMIYQNYCSVQFDHFLRTIGYEPDYDVVTEVERRDGPEIARFHYKMLIPIVMLRLERWVHHQQLMRQRLFRKMSLELEALAEQ
ncbi:uncharacterized protein LOC118457749 [Anopheles albimanus]|uniref:Uncharacterized protein n=1 Tax=Anopheles albimanus TaxID=7167 RepID=A0A182F5M5_ANOAL|nr:uncharacterized protein LOC118457749 [Anopheles albimanus]XP_035775455.1 uncharacterized protein LOC118457749 [Anopheles albimanus]